MNWHGHVARRDEGHMLRKWLRTDTQGKRKRGQSKTIWKGARLRDIVWSYYVQMMGYREIIVTKPYLVSKEAHLYSL